MFNPPSSLEFYFDFPFVFLNEIVLIVVLLFSMGPFFGFGFRPTVTLKSGWLTFQVFPHFGMV